MPDFFHIIKIVAIFQLISIIFLLVLAYGVKIYSYYNIAHLQRINKKLERIIMQNISGKDAFNLKLIMRYKRHTELIINIIHEFDRSIHVERWKVIRNQIIQLIILPNARILSVSRGWTKRYIACQAFKLFYAKQDEKRVKALISDPIPLVSISAAILAVNYKSQALIDAVIDSFSEGRRLQQSLYAQIVSNTDVSIIPLINNRLKNEKNPYVKAFCYRVLTSLPFISELVETVGEDLNSDNLELKLAVLTYLSHNNLQSSGELFAGLLKNTHWQVRAKSAKLLGEVKNEIFAASLETCLKDPEWWVRINAAEALVKLGKKGISILKSQRPNIDPYAYDVARQVLFPKKSMKNIS